MADTNPTMRDHPLINALDSLGTATDMLALVEDLLSGVGSGGVTLTHDGANGLYTILRGCREACQAVSTATTIEERRAPARSAQSPSFDMDPDLDPEMKELMRDALALAVSRATGRPVPDLTEPLSEAVDGAKSNSA